MNTKQKEKIEDLNYYVPFLAWVIAIVVTSVFLILFGFKVKIVLSVATIFIVFWFLLALLRLTYQRNKRRKSLNIPIVVGFVKLNFTMSKALMGT